MQFLLGWAFGGLAFCWFLHRLAVQSSYYANPNRRFCGTLERSFAFLIYISNKLFSYQPFRLMGIKPAPIDRYELKHYAGVRQFWLNPLKAPQCNQWADVRFKERRDEMTRLEAESSAKVDLKPSTILLSAIALISIGCIAFFSLPL